METAAVQAVQPMIREYEHQQDCRAISCGASTSPARRVTEEEAAKEAVRKALAALPIGAAAKAA